MSGAILLRAAIHGSPAARSRDPARRRRAWIADDAERSKPGHDEFRDQAGYAEIAVVYGLPQLEGGERDGEKHQPHAG